MKIRLNIDSFCFEKKPTDSEVGQIRSRLAKIGILEVEPEQLVSCVAQGKSFYPAALSGTKGDSFQSVQVFAADVDNKNDRKKSMIANPMLLEEALEKLGRYNINPYFIYSSFSNTSVWPRYRIVIITDEALTDPDEARTITERLIALLNDGYNDDEKPTDTSTVDNARLFFGSTGDSIIYHSKAITPLDTLRLLPQPEPVNNNIPEPQRKEPPKRKRERVRTNNAPGFVDSGYDLREVLDAIDPNMLDYDEWLSVGMALHNLQNQEPYFFTVDDWDAWSSRDTSTNEHGKPRYNPRDRKKWNGFNRRNGHNYGAEQLIKLAKAQGWTPPTITKTVIPAPPVPHYIEQAAARDRAKVETVHAEPAAEAATVVQIAPTTYEPADYTDVGQAIVYANVFDGIVKYTPATGFLVYDGAVWNESEIKAQGLTQELTEMQLVEARERVRRAQDELNAAVETQDQAKIKAATVQLAIEESYRKYVLGQRKTAKIKATMTEARPKIEIDISALDADGYLLNTPDGSIDLRTGELHPHNALDYCTKITAVGPSNKNAHMFADFIDRVTVGDKDLARYLQEVAGMCAVGRVLRENLIIAYGQGGNGKSTLFNVLAHVMGDYSGNLSAETLTAQCRKNKSPEYAELRGKRIVIAAELDEGTRLDTSVVKKLCSTDDVYAEKKYKDPFSFRPSHTVILYTNHLPRVGTNDKGTWDRLICIPFNARLRGMKGEIPNYADHLFTHCGGAVLKWIVEGAQRFIANEYKIELPQCVVEAVQKYRADNDWLQSFLYDCCEVERTKRERSSDLYNRYREYCDDMGEYIRHVSDFKAALTAAGYETHVVKGIKYVYGVGLKPAELAEVYSPYSGNNYPSQAQ